MKKLLFIFLFLCLVAAAFSAGKNFDPYDFQIKNLYEKPRGDSKVVFQIPIDVRFLDMSEDANWYKTKIIFSVGPVKFQYIGWAYIPVGNLLREQAAAAASAEAQSSE
ncbi:hypothetical protein A2276_01000 [candidate division WOR-1 bacterium RIFOXYA12_FULL_43_27]|uniref:SH3b domain-containing protein n=1 Tax=candidate division WOR-1 bacterium RIFOXYC2_FULL_46_14 TaxID=1802587 RepID=A0A1F4U6L2_UNCSA|nr:MAG: hypothetical protein A2276_01000 [candidate division WOR-1 bacterium RIFOXYA12_FULL_43_27]OGC20737.1 MAG: hypothetical protein A2292_06875 [candidate division WOR-1 bacterium RIFOXYB2_FULL_46_45]OGC31526.1 MAG: hypothetical protein A2232_04575 [candidate division WOR-1 bacterium RIFOXYA2_FULL_46_56]OGC39933.1 MAG: hypothetical protein A2438_05415 [candidate division WOR-1 bacterium RIFOXYC2_FULL_46_14]